jgi:hypothetical protein
LRYTDRDAGERHPSKKARASGSATKSIGITLDLHSHMMQNIFSHMDADAYDAEHIFAYDAEHIQENAMTLGNDLRPL